MDAKWRVSALGCTAVAVLATAGCAAGNGPGSTAAGPTAVDAAVESDAAPTGSADATGAADPSDLATNAPVTLTPGADLVVFVVDARWDPESQSVLEDSFVQSTIDSDGTCTLTLTKDGVRASASVTSEADATTTSCSGASVPGSELSPGTWSAVVTYESGDTRGTSEAREVVVP